LSSLQRRLLDELVQGQARSAEELGQAIGCSYYSVVMCILGCKRQGWVKRGEAVESYMITEAGLRVRHRNNS